MKSIIALFTLLLGPWFISFNEESSILTLKNEQNQVVLSGKLTFESGGKTWRVGLARDNVPQRLTLIDSQNQVFGYISFQQNGDSINLLVHHRTRQFYEGKLTFDGTLQCAEDSFACRTESLHGERVLPLGAGKADSLLNDSVFSTEKDLLVRFLGGKSVITTDKKAGIFHIKYTGEIQEASEASWGLRIEKDYFKTRYVPYYTPIDRKRCPKAPTGWMSWNVYFDKATAEDNLAEARLGKKYLQPFGLEFWSIESWQGNSDQLPVSKFYNLNLEANERQFPKGMKQLATDIRALGFRPGLWVVPFGTGNEEFYQAHKDWFVHNKEGKPLSTWAGKYTLDPTNEEAQKHVMKILDICSHDWGYEFFKIDGMSAGPGYCAHFFEDPNIRCFFKDPKCPNAFEQCTNNFRKAIGPDRVFLACQGHATGPEAAVADASRTGADIVHPNQPVKWANLLNQAGRTLNQIFTHNIVFYSDPDTLLVNEALTLEEARLSATVVSLPGQLMFSGDKLAELPMERIQLLQKALPVCDIHPMALYPCFSMHSIWDLKVARNFLNWDVVALFNWTDQEALLGFNTAELGLDSTEKYILYEYWTNKFQGVIDDKFEMKVPPHAVRLLAVHRLQTTPQFISSDRHITQGAVDLVDLQTKGKMLEVKVTLVENHPTTLRFHLPKGYVFEKVINPEAVKTECKMEENGLLTIKLISKKSDTVPLTIEFK